MDMNKWIVKYSEYSVLILAVILAIDYESTKESSYALGVIFLFGTWLVIVNIKAVITGRELK